MKDRTINAFDKLEIQRKSLISLCRLHNNDQLNFKPNSDSWNILQVLRHVITAEALTLRYIKKSVRNPDNLPNLNFDSRFRSFILKVALKLPIKFKAPKYAEVSEDNPGFEQTMSNWNSVRNEFREFLIHADEEIFSKTVYKHPRAGSLTLFQTFDFMKDHIDHHQKQINRIKNHSSYPD